MTGQNTGKLNFLERTLPDGLLVDAAWMERHGYSTSLRSQYVAAGWLTQPVRGTYKRPRGELTWEKVVVSLQTLMGSALAVGGRTALDLQGFSHYISASGPSVIHLYGTASPQGWLTKLPLPQMFRFHKSSTLFRSLPEKPWLQEGTLRQVPVASEWQMTISTPERALLEMLDELPTHESFHQVDVLMEGLSSLSPRRLQSLISDCHSVKVKRLFFWFAARHAHSWVKQIDRSAVDLGTGKRSLVKGGRLDPDLLITVPDDLDAPL
ncbi:type IV toxin-antitoxin system AbiEi family antitoxin domain-containing protein [Rhizobium mayense]|uniref:Type IV toxin-antitoxin system AbiEi family antitoxin domain-containing protein n=1 Tax=Rhizobium mayense TaxID=1312184 RepID=A0ABT7K3F7_9HYPH|nr:type IV toxin-antitoxin system AbiEi family antitoxin domain-containing protein [Rhizobium mayense]MDL2403031.1 type IV toxin-antitoxin system AbiEi family antitoxin domain-containing protein [Rhizobium mayense]